MPPLEQFYHAIHALWQAQHAVGQAHAEHLPLPARVPLDRRLRQAMIQVELADEAVRVWRTERRPTTAPMIFDPAPNT